MGFGESRVQGLGLGVETVLGSGFRIWGYPGYRLLGLWVHDRAHDMQRLAWRLFFEFS